MNIDKEYQAIKTSYSDFLTETTRIIKKLLAKNKIPIAFDISSRLKELDSIVEKNNSRRFEIKDSITELNDLVGVRIVLLFPEYKGKVIELLLSEFFLIEESRSEESSINTFGYSSVHLILKIRDEWLQSPDWKEHSNKKIEIQIRTLSEHIWAETSHALFYKQEENIPKLISRDFYRLSALLEVVDDKMQNIKSRIDDYSKYLETCSYEEILTKDLFPQTFRRVMLENSNNIYNLSEKDNRILSSSIEFNYNILTCLRLHSIIFGKIDLNKINNDDFIQQAIKLLEEEKPKIDEKQVESSE